MIVFTEGIFIIVIQILSLFLAIHLTPLIFAGLFRAKNVNEWFKLTTLWAFFWTLFFVIHLQIVHFNP